MGLSLYKMPSLGFRTPSQVETQTLAYNQYVKQQNFRTIAHIKDFSVSVCAETGLKVLDGYLTMHETIGEGATCKVKRAVAEVFEDREEGQDEESKEKESGGKLVHQTLALKVYNKSQMHHVVVHAPIPFPPLTNNH